MPTFQYQRVFTRGILILGVLTVVYFGTKDGREFALAKQKEVIHHRAQDIVCSVDYKDDLESFPGLFTKCSVYKAIQNCHANIRFFCPDT